MCSEARAKPRNAELLSPQPSSHDKSMVSPEEHREPSPVRVCASPSGDFCQSKSCRWQVLQAKEERSEQSREAGDEGERRINGDGTQRTVPCAFPCCQMNANVLFFFRYRIGAGRRIDRIYGDP